MDYAADYLSQVLVRDIGERPVVTLAARQTVADVRRWLDGEGPAQAHRGFPVVDADVLVGVVTQRDLLSAGRDPEGTVADLLVRAAVSIGPEATAREAADLMVREAVGLLPVVESGRLVGIVTPRDLIHAHSPRLSSEEHARRLRGLGSRRLRA